MQKKIKIIHLKGVGNADILKGMRNFIIPFYPWQEFLPSVRQKWRALSDMNGLFAFLDR